MAQSLKFSVLYMFCFLFVPKHCSDLACSSKQCRKNACPASCSCLGALVDCADRNLDKIPIDLPTWVEMLDLQYNNIVSVDQNSLNGLQKLRSLDIGRNHLSYLNSSVLQDLSSLQKLFLHSNQLTEVPDFDGLDSLLTLGLQSNKIRDFDNTVLEKLQNLSDLDLGYNSLVELRANTFGYSSNLLHLCLSHNQIAHIETGVFDNLTALVTLKLNRNKLSAIPKDLFRQLNNLQQLEISSNALFQIEGLSFQGLVSLTVLKLHHNAISQLQDGTFYGLNSIKRLRLDHNRISKVTKGWLYGLNSLQRLYLEYNNISMIEDDAWDSGKRLQELVLAHNQLQYVSARTFDKLYSLRNLVLGDNRLTYIEEGSFHSLSALQYLELKNNEVSWTVEDTDNVFSGPERLRELGLSNNKIKSVVKRAFAGLSRLETLNLLENPITTIEQNAFSDLPQLELLMNTDSLLCDCNLKWMAKNFHYPVIVKCAYPDRIRNASVFELFPKDFVCDGLPKPVIVKEPASKITLKGQNVTLECEVKSSNASEIEFHWRKDGKLLPNMRLWSKNTVSKRGNFSFHTCQLFIENIQDKDEGQYQCVISNRYGSVYSNKAKLAVHVYPVFTKTPVDIAIKFGSTARLECGAKGSPPPAIAWKKDGGGEDFPAARERRMHVMPTDDIFFIVGVKTSDNGLYQCTAENVAGLITANATLTVLETPTFVKKMENKEGRVGDTSLLECRVSGSPKPRVTWTKDGSPLVVTNRHFFTVDNQLLIIESTKYSDDGTYTCEISNILGTERGSSHLSVLPAMVCDDSNSMTGVIVIAVVICIVGTSIIWVIVIHRTRKPSSNVTGTRNPPTLRDMGPPSYHGRSLEEFRQSLTNVGLDSHSGHSRNSRAGDSAPASSEDLLIEDDDCGPLLDSHSAKRTAPCHSSVMAFQGTASEIGEGMFAASDCLNSKERVPLLHPFRMNCVLWKNRRKTIAEFGDHPMPMDWYALPYGDAAWPCVQRSVSADEVNIGERLLHRRGYSEPPQTITRVDSDCTERDSGFSSFPRSVTQESVSHWGSESPRLHRPPKSIPNDSGSFSMENEDILILPNPLKYFPSSTPLPAPRVPPMSKSCIRVNDQEIL